MITSSNPSQARSNFQTSTPSVQKDPAQLFIMPVRLPRNITDILTKPIRNLGFDLEQCHYDCPSLETIHRIRGKNRYVGLVHVNDERVEEPRFMGFLQNICGWLDNKGFSTEPGLWLISTREVSRQWDKEVQALREKGKIREIRFITVGDIPKRKTTEKMWNEILERWVERNLVGMGIEPIFTDIPETASDPSQYLSPDKSVANRPQVEGEREATSTADNPATRASAGAQAARISITEPTKRIKWLQERIRSKQVLAIVGAGVSMGATNGDERASWTGLLENGIKFCCEWAKQNENWAQRVRSDIESGDMDDLLCSAQKICAKLEYPNGPNWIKWLRETVGDLKLTQRKVIDALHALEIPIATTNYDGLIEKATNLRPVTWKDRNTVERVLQGDEQRVIHLHGHWESPESVVLGIKSYDELLGDEHAQHQLKQILGTRTLLFVGCGAGMRDPNFGALLRWARGIFSGSEYKHYRLALKKEIRELEEEHREDRFIIVEESGENHDELSSFLERLARPKNN